MLTTHYFLFGYSFSPAGVAPSPPPAPAPAPVANGETVPLVLTLAEVIDDDTEKAIVALWLQQPTWTAVFPNPPRTGRQKSVNPGQDIENPGSGPYVVLDSKLLRRELIGGDSQGLSAWEDHRDVTMTVYGTRAQVVTGLGLILGIFNRGLWPSNVPGKPTLIYPSGARFIRWWPVGNAVIEEDKDSKAGKDIWKGTIRADVWSVRAT